MNYEEPHYLFNSYGRWIGFCLGMNLFDVDTVWRGWFPWDDSADVMSPNGSYLGTVIGNRFYSFDHKRPMRAAFYSAYPAIPLLANKPKSVGAKKLPLGASDLEFKPATVLSPLASARRSPRHRQR